MTAKPPLWKTFVVFLLPMMASNILQALSGTLNNTYLGQMAGVDALAAASAVFPVSFFFISFIMGMSSGAVVLVGQAWGAGDGGRAKAVVGTTLAATAGAGIVIALLGGIFAHQIMSLLGKWRKIAPCVTPTALAISCVVTLSTLCSPASSTAALMISSWRSSADSRCLGSLISCFPCSVFH